MIIYETAPVSMIVGEAAVLDVIRASPVALWERTKQFAGISWEAFELYFLHQPEAFAYSLAAPVLYSSPILLSSIGIATPPQSYCYISQEIYEDVILPRIER